MSEMNAPREVDFDKSGHNFKVHLSFKQVFWGGFLAGALVILALGFVVMVFKGASLGKYFGGSLDRETQPTVQQPTAQQPEAQQPSAPPPAVAKADYVRGDAKAPITMIEYSDIQCPYCSRFHATMLQVMDAYKGQVRWVFRHFPLTSIHPNAQKSAEAAECAGEQGKFWELVDEMYANQTAGLAVEQVEGYAQKVGVKDMAKFKSCVASGKYASKIQADQAGGEASGVNGTPGTFVYTKSGQYQLIPGALPFETVKQVIDAALKS